MDPNVLRWKEKRIEKVQVRFETIEQQVEISTETAMLQHEVLDEEVRCRAKHRTVAYSLSDS